MNSTRVFRLAAAALAAVLFLPGCAVVQSLKSKRPDPRVVRAKEQHAAFRAQPGWRKQTYRDENLIREAADGNTAVEIALREQRGLLLVNGAIAMDFPVATGRASHPTPKGAYKILEKKKEYSSNIYGQIVSGDGTTVVTEADTRDHAVPEGGRFVGAPMPYWMRMSPTGVGMHVGHVPGHRPASHGCIRLKRDTATQLFAMLATGTPVTVDSFAPALGGPVGLDSVVIGEFADKPERPRPAAKPKPIPSPAPAAPPVVATPQPGAPGEIIPAAEAPAEPATPPPSTPPAPEIPPAPTPLEPEAGSSPAENPAG